VQKIRILDVAWPNKDDIDPDRHLDVQVLDGHVKQCAAAVTNALKTPPAGYSCEQAAHMSWMFDAMRFTHSTIRNLIAKGTKSPECVDALPLARMQLEALYSVCLMVQHPPASSTSISKAGGGMCMLNSCWTVKNDEGCQGSAIISTGLGCL
jgi:hypothetical protein